MRLHLALCLLLTSTLLQAELAETDWLALLPAADLLALEQMAEISHDGPEAEVAFGSKGGGKQQDRNLPEVMYSTNTVTALDGTALRIGGYPVPLEQDDEGNSTLFFLVPYPGACIHVPAPPPNQIILVRYPEGISLDNIYNPLWVSGTLHIEPVNNDLADAAYALDASHVRWVEEADLD